MIAKVTRGQRPSGAVRYLFGPGRYNEHEDPHVVAASASLRVEAGLRPTTPELEGLAAAMDVPAVLFGSGGARRRLLAPVAVDQGRDGPRALGRRVGRGGERGDEPARF